MDSQQAEVTRLLRQWSEGREGSLDALVPHVYDELRRLAGRYLQRERPGHTLQATALVHEAFLKLVDQHAPWQNRAHFFGVAAQLMRRILVDYAREHAAAKRGGGVARVELDEAAVGAMGIDINLLALDEALTRLAALDGRQARIVELKFFAGLTLEETAEVLDISAATVSREWTIARAWLFLALKEPS